MESFGYKPEMFRLLEQGVFGNHTRVWYTPEALIESGFDGLVALRSMTIWTKFKPGMSTADCINYYQTLIEQYPATSLIFHEWTPPDSFIAICHLGYAWDKKLELLWSYNCNIAVDQHIASDIDALIQCKAIIGEKNWLRLQELFYRYPYSTIEFTFHNRGVGVLNRNLVIWEVRANW